MSSKNLEKNKGSSYYQYVIFSFVLVTSRICTMKEKFFCVPRALGEYKQAEHNELLHMLNKTKEEMTLCGAMQVED